MADKMWADINERFNSGNSIPIDRAYLKREEWEAIMATRKAFEPLLNAPGQFVHKSDIRKALNNQPAGVMG